MIQKTRRVFFLLLLLMVLLVVVNLPQQYRIKGRIGEEINKRFQVHLGLDLSGGTHLALEADMKNVPKEEWANALESAKQVIERRVNLFGVSEPVVQSAVSGEHYRIIVELPGVTNVDQAVELIGQTAQLEFREFAKEEEATEGAFVVPTLATTLPTGLNGQDLKRAMVGFSTQTGEPEVSLEFSSVGGKKFAEITRRLIGKPLAIFLDDFPITWPRVNTEISDGRAVITGQFTQEVAKTLALQLNAGALPVPVSVVEQRVIGASLGAESVNRSIAAGLIGLAIVAVFMIAKYGWLGLIADLALILYGLLNLALYQLIPITLTLPGIAGFLLSIGMAVDSNILIFERFKEEKRMGKPWRIAMEMGFGKAWDSIRDANFTTLLTCAILFNPGNWDFLPSSGLVRGFAVTLFIGVMTSLFTGIVATRTFVRILYKEREKKI